MSPQEKLYDYLIKLDEARRLNQVRLIRMHFDNRDKKASPEWVRRLSYSDAPSAAKPNARLLSQGMKEFYGGISLRRRKSVFAIREHRYLFNVAVPIGRECVVFRIMFTERSDPVINHMATTERFHMLHDVLLMPDCRYSIQANRGRCVVYGTVHDIPESLAARANKTLLKWYIAMR